MTLRATALSVTGPARQAATFAAAHQLLQTESMADRSRATVETTSIQQLVVAMRHAYEFGKTSKPAVAQVLMKAGNLPAEAARQYADLWDGLYTVGMEPSDVASMKKQFDIFKSVGAVKGELPANAFATAPYEKSKTMK